MEHSRTRTSATMNTVSIPDSIPHRGPMLLIDRVVSHTADDIVCRRKFHGDEFFFQGHYPDYPLVPGVILCECAAQAAALLIANRDQPAGATTDQVPVLTRMNNVRFKKMVHPGDEIEITVHLDEFISGAWLLSARIRLDGKLAASLELVCATAARPAPNPGLAAGPGESS